MTSKISRRTMQLPARPVGQRASPPGKTARVPAVARRGRLTLQQINPSYSLHGRDSLAGMVQASGIT
jgi:hypothetical protein